MLTIDIHHGKPTVDTAISNLLSQIKLFKSQKQKALCIITGYGSLSGKHKIKSATIEILMDLKTKNQIKDFIKGEDIDIFSNTYHLFKYKELITEDIKRKPNPGFIVVIL